MGKPQVVELKRFLVHGEEANPYAYTYLLGFKSSGVDDLIKRVEKGFSYKALESIQRIVGLATPEFAPLVQMTARTLARRKETGRLESDESDRLLRISRIIGQSISLFEGDFEAARTWLKSPVLALGNKSPIELCATEIGAREVENLIGRLEHGVFA